MQKIISHRAGCSIQEGACSAACLGEMALGWEIMSGFGGRSATSDTAETVADWLGQVYNRQRMESPASHCNGFWQAFASPEGPGA